MKIFQPMSFLARPGGASRSVGRLRIWTAALTKKAPMKHSTFITALLLLFSLASTANADGRRNALHSIDDAMDSVDDDRGRTCRSLAARDLRDAREAVRKATKSTQLTKAARWLGDLASDARNACEASTIRSIRHAQRDVEDFAASLEKSASKEKAKGPVAMSASEFAQLKKAVRAASFSDDKVGVIQGSLAHNYATVSQLIELVKMISYDDDRLTVVSRVWKAIVDRKKNGYKIASAFSYSDSGKKAIAILTQ